MQVIKSEFLISHNSPSRLKQFCENAANIGTGIERYLKYKIKCKFNVKLFTSRQKQCLKYKFSESSYQMNGSLVVGPRTYDKLMEISR